MESTVEQRLKFLEARVKTLEGLLGLDAAPVSAPVVPPAPRRPWAGLPAPVPARPAAPSKPPPDLEEILGGRVLGWVGGIAVTIAAIFFVVMAVRKGGIGEGARNGAPVGRVP